MDVENIAKNANSAFLKTMNLSCEVKNQALYNIIAKLQIQKNEILKANELDLSHAKTMLDNNEINKATFDRLKLNENKIQGLIEGLNDLIKLDDPVNCVLWQKELDEGLILKKISTPIGVIGVIFEARPDCYIQIASLLIKSGNCGILKGGIESINTNKIMAEIVNSALQETKEFPLGAINLIESRDDVKKMLDMDDYINLIIPRGSNKLVSYIKENTKIPVLGHSSGICHIFVDENADFENTLNIIIDAKTQYPSACNAVETVLVHKEYPYFEKLKTSLLNSDIKVVENPENYSIEYGDKILNIKTVENIDEAIEHINKYGSHHTDCILSDDEENINKFMNLVDSSSVFSNCSTRFSDGFRYGFGAEVGISTNKTHARGPVGLEGLTIYKYQLFGSNNLVAPYATGEKKFSHKLII
ncbi:MAG: glutamate-5-semialdehyde dehydrogenase [Candidatus Gastranaerophilales bacterium]|nr:glutamate-5-semialdehyde dehydrogenase [Candidatus Gastranaerophilales bacterium]